MDTNYPAGTPREGYPIEIQALWYNALNLLAQHETTEAKRAARAAMAKKVRTNVLRYYLTQDGWLSDCLHAAKGVPAAKAIADDHLRPNQLFAITLGLVDSPDVCKTILEATSELLIPGAIRTLADRDVRYPLPVRDRNGALLNDPTHPYRGRYEGDEDTRRKVAYPR
jgi:glycogen debranching enzyme